MTMPIAVATNLAEILERGKVWRGAGLGQAIAPSLASGFAELDAELPGGGWPTAALTEILPQHDGIGELRILGHALANLSARGRWLAWIAPPYLPYAPALQAAGIDLARLLFIKTRSPRETLWAIEQTLRSNACGAVLAWPDRITYPELRRLQLAAEGNPGLAVLFRAPRSASDSTPAALRLSLQTCAGDLAVRVLKRRGALLGNPLLLRPQPIVNRNKSGFKPHVVDRTQFPLPAARSVPAGISAI
jgi:protein ImuA